MLKINNLHVKREKKEILKGVDLEINSNEIHAVMGPNGSGKSTLANALMGNPNMEVTEGSVEFKGEDLLDKEVDERAKSGLFMAFQYPVEVPGVPLIEFMKMAYQERTGKKITPGKFRKLVTKKAEDLKIKKDLINRYLNEGFSGGEKKKVEVLQMSVLEPNFAILDETDSGLDVSALRIVAKGVNKIQKETGMGVLLITHYSRILEYIKPDYVHILADGKVVKTGDSDLATTLEEKGYEKVLLKNN